MSETRYSELDLRLALLRLFGSESKSKHKANVLGGRGGRGELERQLDTDFTDSERALAHRSMESLEKDGLIQPTYRDVISPLEWLTITETGKKALELNAADVLDHSLNSIDSSLVENRHGAWAAAESDKPDTVRQAAHSSRELLRSVLKKCAPDEHIRRCEWFGTKDRIERHDRTRFIMETKRGVVSKSTLKVVEAQCNLVDTLYDRLSAIAHHDNPVHLRGQAKRLLRAVEDALLEILQAEEVDKSTQKD